MSVFVLSSYDTTGAGAVAAAIVGVYATLDAAKTKIEALGKLDKTPGQKLGLGTQTGDSGKGNDEGEIHYYIKEIEVSLTGGRRSRKSKRRAPKTRRSRK
jgi:hypothetical protein